MNFIEGISDWTVSYVVLHLTVLLTAQFLKPGSYGNAFTPLALLLESAYCFHLSVYFSASICSAQPVQRLAFLPRLPSNQISGMPPQIFFPPLFFKLQ